MTDLALIEQAVREQVAATRAGWPEVAAGLWALKETKAWEAVGAGSFKEWLGQPDVSLNYRTAQEYVAAHDELVVRRAVPVESVRGATPGKLAVVLPSVKAGTVGVEEAVGDAVALSRADLIAKYREKRGEPDRVECPMCGSRVGKEKLP